MKVLVIVAPLAAGWIQPGGLLEFCKEMEPRLENERRSQQTVRSTRPALPDLGNIIPVLPSQE